MHVLQRTRRVTASYSITTQPDTPTAEFDYAQCCHCAKHFHIIAGSKIIRGFCQRCNAVTCGLTACMSCVHFEKKMELEFLAIKKAVQKDKVRSALFEMLGISL